jgi:hypothetical protein
MDPMATHCRKLIVTGIYQVKPYMSYLQQYTQIISGVPSARRFYFFIRSVRAFGTTQSLLFISFTKPSMTTLPSSSSKVKPCLVNGKGVIFLSTQL